jgi:hypothetical protein
VVVCANLLVIWILATDGTVCFRVSLKAVGIEPSGPSKYVSLGKVPASHDEGSQRRIRQ